MPSLAEELRESGFERKAVVVVTHGVFMKFLAEDESIDLPKAGWEACTVEGRSDRAILSTL